MNKIYIVSRYLGIFDGVNRFHFIGYFKGKRIQRVEVQGGEFESDCDYVLAVTDSYIRGLTMHSILIKSKKIT